MDNSNEIIAFPVCIKKDEEEYKLYVPEIDYEAKAQNFPNALHKSRGLILFTIAFKEMHMDDFPEDICSKERVKDLLIKNNHEEYMDAEIAYVDIDLKEANITGKGKLTVELPQSLISTVETADIDYTKIIEGVLQETVRRKMMLDRVKDWTGSTVAIKTEQGIYYGQINAITNSIEDPWDFTVDLQVGLYNTLEIGVGAIKGISKTPVIFTEFGTYYLTSQHELVSITGHLWWKRSHIDVYLEYEPDKELEEQKTFQYLTEFNEHKYVLDHDIKNSIAVQLMSSEELCPLFQNYTWKNKREMYDAFVSEVNQRMNLWFINVTLNKDI